MTSLLIWKSLLLMDGAAIKSNKKLLTKPSMQLNEDQIKGVNKCRICDQEDGEIPILNNVVYPNISEEIHNFSGVKVELYDGLSKYMCQNCLDLLNGCIMFREMCRKTNKMIIEISLMKDNCTQWNNSSQTECDSSNSIPSPSYSEECTDNWANKEFFRNLAVKNTKPRKIRRKNDGPELGLCDVCGKTVLSRSLQLHKTTHKNIFPYKCDKCPYKSRTRDLLKTHKLSHLPKAELPYKCTQCPTAMSSASNLAKHMRYHARVRAKTQKHFKCTFCETAFVYKYDMTRHIKQKHVNSKQTAIECAMCSVQFNSSFDLPQKCLTDLNINNENYNVTETYHIGSDVVPTDAHYDTYGNLFYVESLRNNDGYHFNINVVKFKSSLPQKVPGLPEGVSYSIAIDVKKTKVYFGTGKGMFSYNYDSQTAVPITNSSMKLDMVFVDKNSNKYIIENVNGIEEFYLLDGANKIRCQNLEALNEMAIDNKNNFYFIREDKLYMLKSTHETPTCIGDVNYGGNAQISFHKDNVFVASDKLSYFHENDTGNLKLVDNIPGSVTAIAFDHNGEFVLGIQGKLLKYKKCECYLRKNKVIDEYSTSM